MSDASPIESAFDATRANVYDQQFVKLHAIKDLIHLIVRVHFSTLPDDARILVAGAGTGAEVRYLAPLFPKWHFTLVDPSAPMLEVAHRHARSEGFAERCTFHTGLVSSLPNAPYDAATSILVSHFLTQGAAREAFFSSIAQRLAPGGLFFNADICMEQDAHYTPEALALWLEVLSYADALSRDEHAQYRSMFGQAWAAHAPAEVAAMMTRANFDSVLPCYQACVIRGWTAVRAAAE